MRREDVQVWLDRYIAAWSNYDETAIGDLFADEAEYRYQPWADPVVGRAAIVADWLSNKDEPGTWAAHYDVWSFDGERADGIGESRYTNPDGSFRIYEYNALGLTTRVLNELGAEALVQQRHYLENRLRVLEEQARVAGEREQTQSRLLEQGLITKQALLQTQQERANLTLDAENARNQIKELSLKKLDTEKLSRSELSTIENQVNEAQRTLDSLLESKKLTTSLLSPFDGRVVEIKAGVGSLIAQGSSVINVELAGKKSGIGTLAPAHDGAHDCSTGRGRQCRDFVEAKRAVGLAHVQRDDQGALAAGRAFKHRGLRRAQASTSLLGA